MQSAPCLLTGLTKIRKKCLSTVETSTVPIWYATSQVSVTKPSENHNPTVTTLYSTQEKKKCEKLFHFASMANSI